MELSNGLVRLEFDDGDGNLRQITDLSNGQTVLNRPDGNRLLRLTLSSSDLPSQSLSTHEGSQVTFEKRGERLTIQFPRIMKDHKPTGISAIVTVRLPAGGWEAFFRVEIENQGPDTIDEVVFPWVGGWTGFAGKGKDRITAALTSADPHTVFPSMRAWTFGRANQRFFWPSEYHQVHLCDISGGGRGISCNLYTSLPRIHGLYFENLSRDYVNLCLSWGWVSCPGLQPGGSWTSPEVGLGVHQGDWHESADRLRRSIHRWWLAPPVTDRLRRTIGYHNIQLTGHNREFYHNPSELPAIARDCLQYGVQDLCVWDYKSQTYVAYEDSPQWVLPSETEARLRQALAETRKLGCNVSAYVDYWLTVENNQVFRDLSNAVVLSRFGKPIPSNIRGAMHHVRYNADWLEQGGRILCQKAPEFQRYAVELSRRVLDLGFDSIFIDGGSSWHLCHARNHGHVSPDDGLEGCLDWQRSVMEMVKARNPEGYIFGECPDSFNSQVLDMVTRWWGPSEPMEIYRYVLPEVLLPYPADENDQDLMPKAFARGHSFALMTTNMDGLLSDHPAFAARVKRLGALRQRTAEYLALGQFRDQQGLKVEGGEGYSYTSNSGLAVAFANSQREEHAVKIALAPGVLNKTLGKRGFLFLEEGTVKEVEPTETDGTLALEAKMPGCSNGVLCIPEE